MYSSCASARRPVPQQQAVLAPRPVLSTVWSPIWRWRCLMIKHPSPRSNLNNNLIRASLNPATGVCENNDHRHNGPCIAISVPTRKMQYEMHVAIYGSLWRWSLFSQTPVLLERDVIPESLRCLGSKEARLC